MQPDAITGNTAGDAGVCLAWDPQHFDPTQLVAPVGPLNLSAAGTYIYDTDQLSLRDPGGGPINHATDETASVVVISVDSFDLASGATLRAIGTRPLLIASRSSITVAGEIDVSSPRTGVPGAGANPGACLPATPGEDDVGGAAGGGGGGFGTDGGRGGDGDANSSSGGDGTAVGGEGGAAVPAPTVVIGGCPGARGGEGEAGRADPGNGGGAIQLTACQQITVSGTIQAGGGGGESVNREAGGAGGGSGGFIGLDAPIVDVSGGSLAANGGGGGGGGDFSNAGEAGSDGALGSQPAAGGRRSNNNGTDGGAGGAGATLNGQGVPNPVNGAGGGGGGGVGFVLIWTESLSDGGVTISPPATRLP